MKDLQSKVKRPLESKNPEEGPAKKKENKRLGKKSEDNWN